MKSTVTGRTRPVQQLAEPARFWIAYAPRQWRSADNLWTDLASGRINGHRGAQDAPIPNFDASELDDLLYLPPVNPALAKDRDRLAANLTESGIPVLVQLVPGETTAVEGVQVVYDLLWSLVFGEVERLAELPAETYAVWPLISGLTDRPDLWDEGCSLLEIVGVPCVQPVVVELEPTVRRRLVEERGDDFFDAIFHGEAATEQQFAAYADRYGLEVFVPRHHTGYSPRRTRNRKIASDLALAAEVWLRLGKSMSVGQSLFRAARGAEHTRHDVSRLVQEGNLGVMNWLDAHSIDVVEQLVEEGYSSFLEELMEEYKGRRKSESETTTGEETEE